PTGLGGYVYSPPPPVRYVCEHCAECFPELEALRRHRFERHPLRQPALWLRGRAVGALPVNVLSALRPDQVVVEDASRCVMNGLEVALADLGLALAGMSREFVTLELSNGGAVTRCVLDFRIADEGHLVNAESAFLRMARDKVLSLDAVSRFIQDCRAFEDAMPYCDGICHYLYGVMAKERSAESGLRPNQYAERFVRASDELAGFDRPLARSIRALVAFHFNQFDEAEMLAPEGALKNAAGAFAGLLQGMPWHYESAFSPAPGSTVEDLLTDQDTLQVLADASHGLVELKARTHELQEHLRHATAGYDRLKRVLLTSEALAEREDVASHLAAERLAREMAGNPDTRAWAEAMRERLKTP
ncbi:MAG: hypothetical protein KKG11_06290, partial [Gammaproteobacteria bacterium]|nr:hypothetical protein [Gammaproteobacteria bacterium]